MNFCIMNGAKVILRVHVGTALLHVPVAWHVKGETPLSTYPVLQVNDIWSW